MVDLNVNRWLEQRLIVCRIFYFNGALIDLIEGRRRQGFPTQGMAKELLKSITEEGLCTIQQKVAKRSKVSMTCYYSTDVRCFC
jgi:hypothetical protein